MVKLIAHRALRQGPNSELENRIDQINECIDLGYDVEIDLRFLDNKWWLGHDNPTYETNLSFLTKIKDKAWIHAKNIECLHKLMQIKWSGHVFWHQNDDVVLTNTGFLWTFPGKTLTNLSICVMPEWIPTQYSNIETMDVYGICSDFVDEISTRYK